MFIEFSLPHIGFVLLSLVLLILHYFYISISEKKETKIDVIKIFKI